VCRKTLIRCQNFGNRRAPFRAIPPHDMAEAMPLSRMIKTLFALALSAAATHAAAAPETVHFTSLDGATNLTAFLSRPADQGDAPRPALVLLHGCSGLLNKAGRITPHYRSWTRVLLAKGYVVLAVDSATPRGFGQTCTAGPDLMTMLRDRPKDAYAALQYLQAQNFVQGDHVGLIGWSQGGGVVLTTINDKSIGRPAELTQDFRVAVSFYPGACSERRQSKPYTEVEPDSWTTKMPLLLLMGEADTWTPYPPCAAFLEAAKARGNSIEIKSYPGAVHAFDAPDLDRVELPQYRTGDGPIPVEETDEEARADAILRVLGYLKAHLE
jgi:dienelactone hydrolase